MQKLSTKDPDWFTERAEEIGTAFSLSIKTKLHEEQTDYQFLEIYETTHFGNLMVLDGFIMLSQRDNFIYHEMMVHPALYSHPKPGNVVIIGGGDCGSLKEVLQHECVKQVRQIDIDERVTANARRFFPELCESNNDPRAELLFMDGIAWMKQIEPGSIDVIIVDSTDPVGPAKGLFSESFYQSCFRALSEDGIVVQQSESPIAHADSIIYPMRAAMQQAGFTDTNTLFFPLPVYPTGWWSATIASKKDTLKFARRDDAENKEFTTKYYNSAIHTAAFTIPEFLNSKG